MTLLLTEISMFGIVFTADSRICIRKGNQFIRDRDATKIFPIHYLNAGIGYFGCAYVGNEKMEDWLRKFINKNSSLRNLRDFSLILRDTINKSLKGKQRNEPLGFHISGYVLKNEKKIPSFFFVWNFDLRENLIILPEFRAEDHFLDRDVRDLSINQIDQLLRERIFVYRNGWLNPYTELASHLYDFFDKASKVSGFKPMKSINEFAKYSEFHLETIKLIFKNFFHRQVIGGKIRQIKITKDGIVS